MDRQKSLLKNQFNPDLVRKKEEKLKLASGNRQICNESFGFSQCFFFFFMKFNVGYRSTYNISRNINFTMVFKAKARSKQSLFYKAKQKYL